MRKTPRTLTAKTSSHSATSTSVNGATGPAIPALLTRIETSASASSRPSAATCSALEVSQTATRVGPSISSATADNRSRVRPTRTTWAP